MFPGCVDLGAGVYGCRCQLGTCGDGGSCVDGAKTCQFVDHCEDDAGLLSICTSGVDNSSWERGKPSGSGNPGCHSGTDCWATNLNGEYNDCEKSCVQSTAINVAGVTGTISVRFWAWHYLELFGHDGVSPLMMASTGLQAVDPTIPANWSIDPVVIDGCDFTENWPAFGDLVAGGPAPSWQPYQFDMSSSWQPQFFHDHFEWRVYLETDLNLTNLGWYMDDIVVRVTQEP
jgi:hypothetical protein